jgi:hypothetical protein
MVAHFITVTAQLRWPNQGGGAAVGRRPTAAVWHGSNYNTNSNIYNANINDNNSKLKNNKYIKWLIIISINILNG